MDTESNARVLRWALAAVLLLPVGCSSPSSRSGTSAFTSPSPSPSNENSNQGSGTGSSYGNGEADAGTTPVLGASADSGVATAEDAAMTSNDAAATPPVDSAPASPSFAGTFSCTLTFNYNLTSPIGTSGNEPSTGELTTTESGGVVSADFGGDAGISCTLTFADNGDGMSTLSPADSQTCDVTAMGVAVQVSFTSGGTADLALPMLNASIPFQLSDGPGGDLGIQGTGSLTASCTEM